MAFVYPHFPYAAVLLVAKSMLEDEPTMIEACRRIVTEATEAGMTPIGEVTWEELTEDLDTMPPGMVGVRIEWSAYAPPQPG